MIALTDHPLEGHRDGDTFDPDVDLKPLNKQMLRVYLSLNIGTTGGWKSIEDISLETGDPGASVSARIRDFRKAKFGGHTVERIRAGRTWYYRLTWNTKYPRPTQEDIDQAYGWS